MVSIFKTMQNNDNDFHENICQRVYIAYAIGLISKVNPDNLNQFTGRRF